MAWVGTKVTTFWYVFSEKCFGFFNMGKTSMVRQLGSFYINFTGVFSKRLLLNGVLEDSAVNSQRSASSCGGIEGVRVLKPVLVIFLVTVIKYNKQLNGGKICFSSWFEGYRK